MNKVLINIDVPALDAGVTFYTGGLDFKLKRTLFQRSVAELVLGEATVYLIEQQQGAKPFLLTPLADPFGHGICLLEFSEEGYDTVAD